MGGPSLDDETTSREKALKTLVAGQQAENLLDFDEPDPLNNAPLTGIAAFSNPSSSNPLSSTNAPSKILTSSNPLDDLVSIFGSASMSAPVGSPGSAAGLGGMGAFGGFDSLTSPVGGAATPVVQAQPRKPQEDLLDLF